MARFYKTCGILLRTYFFQIGQTICKVRRNISLFLAQRCSHDSFKYQSFAAMGNGYCCDVLHLRCERATPLWSLHYHIKNEYAHTRTIFQITPAYIQKYNDQEFCISIYKTNSSLKVYLLKENSTPIFSLSSLLRFACVIKDS